MARGEELTVEQWAVVAPLIPEPPRREDKRGRPCRDTREVIDGVLWAIDPAAENGKPSWWRWFGRTLCFSRAAAERAARGGGRVRVSL